MPIKTDLIKTVTYTERPPINLYKLRENYVVEGLVVIEKGRTIVKWDKSNGDIKVWVLATNNKKHFKSSNIFLSDIINKRLFTPLNISDIMTIKPHWHKEFKQGLVYLHINI